MRRNLFRISALALAVFIFPSTSYGAFGISPPFVHATHLVPGATYKQTIWLVQSNVDEDMRIQANLDVPERIRSWISLDKGFEFTIPKDTRQFPVELQINVPTDAALAVYNGTVSFTGAPSSAGQVTIALGAQVSISMIVGDDIYRKISVPVVKILDIEEGWDPKAYVKLVNDGNVPEQFTGATFELLDQYGAVRLAFAQKNRGFEEVAPFSSKEFTVDFPVGFHLGIGEYWGKVDFYQDENLIASQKTVFNVLKAGSLSGAFQRVLQFFTQQWPIGVGAIAIALGGAYSYRIFRRRRA
jgi:hypothetical protein